MQTPLDWPIEDLPDVPVATGSKRKRDVEEPGPEGCEDEDDEDEEEIALFAPRRKRRRRSENG